MAANSDTFVTSSSNNNMSFAGETSEQSGYRRRTMFYLVVRKRFFDFRRVCRDPDEGWVIQEVARDICHPKQNRCWHVQQGVSSLREGWRREKTVCYQAHQANDTPGEITPRNFLSTEDRVREKSVYFLYSLLYLPIWRLLVVTSQWIRDITRTFLSQYTNGIWVMIFS